MTAEDLDRRVAEAFGWRRATNDADGDFPGLYVEGWWIAPDGRCVDQKYLRAHHEPAVQMVMLHKLGDLRGWELAFAMVLLELGAGSLNIEEAITRAFLAARGGGDQ